MKKITILPFLLLLITIFISSCTEDKYADWKIINDKWLDKHRVETGFNETETGLCYKVIHQGEMGKPTMSAYNGYGSYIKAKYTGKLVDGTVFDSGVFQGYLGNAIAGWQEALLKMNVGGHYIIYVPSSLGYGDTASGSIPPYSVLQFDIELLDSRNQL